MATPKKKHLIDLMIEAGVKWPEGAEYAAQDKNQDPGKADSDLVNIVSFYSSKPTKAGYDQFWFGDNDTSEDVRLPSLCRNWHQTIVTREQYAEAVALTANVGEPAADAVEWHNPPSIEQLTSDYHAKAAEADRLQSVADEALKAADDALLALEKAGELLGLVISVDTKPKLVERLVEQMVKTVQPIIADWRDLQVGDVVWWEGDARIDSGEYTVERVEEANYTGDCPIFLSAKEWVDVSCEEWHFIRRP